MKHPKFQKLVDYLDDQLNVNEAQEIKAHVTACAQCETELNRARYLVTTRQDDDLITPELSLLNRVVTAFRRQQNRLPDRPQRGASLEFDSWTQMAPLGVRGVAQERQMLFSEDMFDIDLQIVKGPPNSSTFTLRGQFLINDDASGLAGLDGIEIRLTDAAKIEWRVLTDTLGQFSFSQLSEGFYTLNVILEDHDINLEEVELKA